MMEWSEDSKDIRGALYRAQKDMSDPVKDGTNPHHGNRFPTLESVLAAVKPVLHREGLLLLQPMSVEPDGTTTQITEIYHLESGQWVRSTSSLKAAGKQLSHAAAGISTYLRRYSLMSLLALAPEDADGNDASAVVAERKDGRTGEEVITDALTRTRVSRQEVDAWCEAHKKPTTNQEPRKIAAWLLGKGAATVRAWVVERDREAEPAVVEKPAPAPEPDPPKKWTTPEQRAFFGDVKPHVGPKGTVTYEELAEWCEVHGRPRPSEMPPEQRAKLVAAIVGEADLATQVAEWAANKAADEVAS